MKRISLFLLTNFLVVLSIGLIANGIMIAYPDLQFNLLYLLIFSTIWGFSGALISLFISKALAKKMYDMHIITYADPSARNQELRMIVEELSKKAGIKTPEIAIYDGNDVNAFATGATRDRSLVAFSLPLLENMTMDEIEGVAAHEIAHIANGDMVTMTLLQGVVNSFVIFMARAIAQVFVQSRVGFKGFSFIFYFIIVAILETVFMIFGSIIIAAFSRHREYKADAGGASLAGAERMAGALRALQEMEPENRKFSDKNLAAFKIFGGGSIFSFIFSTHPPLSKRIKRILK